MSEMTKMTGTFQKLEPICLNGVETYLFDLDNTLYHESTGLMEAMMVKMREFVAQFYGVSMEEADKICVKYWKTYGTTLCGLMTLEKIQPEEFLDFVHDIDLSIIKPCTETLEGLKKLEGRKFIFTNADKPHAERVLERMGIANQFEGIYDVIWSEYKPKPDRTTYERLMKHLGADAQKTVMLEDTQMNLKTAHDMGMKTVLIHGDTALDMHHDHVHQTAACMPSWLSSVTKVTQAA